MTLSRRTLFAASALVLAAPHRVWAQAATSPPAGPFTLPPLPYPADANEAAIDARTMEIHHRFHHGAQVANLNAAVANHPQVAAMPLDQILMRLSEMPESVRTAIRNNGGGHANHSMFWTIMGGRGGEPTGELAAAIARDFGSIQSFREQFERASNTLFGSGWAFVTVSREGRLAIVQKPNQDNPLMDGQRVLMGNDVWEHAYYLRYQNRRAEYVRNWWNVLDWEKIAARYAAARAGTLAI
ncbi:superoxide dismutase [Elioraea tepida]|jgi:Fe-Mn family superoxide dismutase|uniref:Superoxide dismutase n=1 Tax=Elioraea tepida TaxID=2843330 RepID=A0A975YKL7_9PROT|nr:superoxide dismutase [Elioraea tepida]QXM25900.1 superoxide dismutase [Elioraea tepida]